MLPPSSYRAENVQRARYAHIAIAVVAVVFCGYLVLMMMGDLRGLWQARSAERCLKAESVKMAARAREAKQQQFEPRRVGIGSGLELFAVQMARWTSARHIRMESLTPDGSPTPVDVKVSNSSLGRWKANKVTVQGSGQFGQVMGLMDEFLNPRMPVQLEAFSLQAMSGGEDGSVSFQFVLTVYEKESGGA